MSIFQSFNIGVAALRAQSNAIGVISDNLANVSTVGYKKSDALFRSLVMNDRSAFAYSPGGAISSTRQINQSQGIITSTQSTTDIAISGNGFFAVRANNPASGDIFYTRAGAFSPDRNGNLVNGAGFFLQGWALDANGNLPPGLSATTIDSGTALAALTTVNPRTLSLPPVATTQVSLIGNLRAQQTALPNSSINIQTNLLSTQLALPTGSVAIAGNLNTAQTVYAPPPAYDPSISSGRMASGSVTADFTRSIDVIDNTGATRSVNVSFLKTAANTWAVEIYAQPAAQVTQPDGLLSFGAITFNADGTLATVSPALTASISADWDNIGGATSLTFDFGTIGSASGLAQSTGTNTATHLARSTHNPAVAAQSMASGAITPHYTSSVSVLDDTGVSRTLNISYVKTGVDTWGVEIIAVPASSVTTPPGGVPGQVAFGTVVFNSGAIESISPSLSGSIAVGWNGANTANNISIDWPGSGSSTGLRQSTSAFSSTLAATLRYNPTAASQNMTSGAVAPHFDSSVTVVDPAGTVHTLKVGYLKTGVNTWAVEIFAVPATDLAGSNAQVASGILTFNGDGTLQSVSPSLSGGIATNWANGQTNSISIDWGTAGPIFGTPGATVFGLADGLSQLNNNYKATVTQNGFTSGDLEQLTVSEEGFLIGTYNNNTSRRLYRIPLANFVEPNELQSVSGNIFAITQESGGVTFSRPTENATGELKGGALESSNVEIQDQLVNMIVAQRAYQSNSQTISTTDEMLQTLDRMLS